jgi:aldehyde:ferredoxin oxidoreductase
MKQYIRRRLQSDISIIALEKAGEFILNLSRLFNIGEEFKADDDYLPARFLGSR